MNALVLKAWFCILLLFSAGVAGAWQSVPPGEPMPCDQMTVLMAQSTGHEHHQPDVDGQSQKAPTSECASLGLCCLGSCMAPIALQSKPLQSNTRAQASLAAPKEALTQTPYDPHFRPPIAA